MNVAQILAQSGARNPGKIAVDFEGTPYTYAQIDERVKRCAGFLKQIGVKKGDRVAIQVPKSMEFVYVHLATLALGAICVPLNTGYPASEVQYFIEDSGSTVFVTYSSGFSSVENAVGSIKGLEVILLDDQSPSGHEPLCDHLEKASDTDLRTYPTEPDDVAVLFYTSGTTGKPKGAMITHKNLISNTQALHEIWHWSDQDVLLHVLPLFHVHGLAVALYGGLYAGATIVMHERFDPRRTWETLEKVPCTIFMGVPTMYYRMMQEWESVQPDLSKMRVFISGSAPLLENLFYRFEKTTGFRILERYGMTEALMITSNPYEPERRIPRSVGYPLPGMKIRIVSEEGEDVEPGQVGEVWVKGNNVFKGYWNNPEKTSETFCDGWLKSGDLGYQDPEDDLRLYLVGRAKELIITGGYNVYPKEVENVLEEHESVMESAVVGIPDQDYGEKVVAAVVLKGDMKSINPEELIKYCKTKLASYKCPKMIFKMDSLPRNAMGKVQKHVLQKVIISKLEGQ
ncbi:MAG TPA: long-chain-fatty-acid--CoA ligase [Thermodesulforhabdus norvegica]|uniref:Long-chain-fatty-acid--CoA ligase n=1 Tax=Thermodesulforhabdus norvegica TaxID=39841 RepID=A0A7C0WS49_9BACT|nr:long-chain-fatty-acid--CoA ligase [Thermodesulforhabdus norvegica]